MGRCAACVARNLPQHERNDMPDSFGQIRSELFELMGRMRHGSFTPPTPDGMTPSEARTIMAVDEMVRRHGEARPNRVAEFVRTTPSALSQTLRSLEDKNLIERRRLGGDYRGVTVSLTQDGERLAQEGRRLRDEYIDRAIAHVGEEDMRHLVRILGKMAEFREQHSGLEAASACEGCASRPFCDDAREDHPADAKGGDVSCA